MTTGTHREENGQGHTTAISKRGAASVTGKEIGGSRGGFSNMHNLHCNWWNMDM